ncbi:MAG: OmpA family protein [Bacteroidales bacterium]|jgi:outer membrane protein OmpA-like peptidoglycan-associated protein/tetratricopeptide (TPR) repeat protein|nr:OmpA family protein [Bacteroidales bacterium]
MKKLFCILALLFVCGFVFSQNEEYHTKSKAAIKCFEKAVAYYQNGKSDQTIKFALQEADNAIAKDSMFIEPYMLKAEIYDFLGDIKTSIKFYEKVVDLDPHFDYGITLKLAMHNYGIGEYASAKKYIDFFYENADLKVYKKYDTDRLREYITFSDSAVRNPVNFRPHSVGRINTEWDEYWPSLSADEEMLVFTRQIPLNPRNPSRSQSNMHEDLFYAYRNPETGKYDAGAPLPGRINTELNEGAQCISADGKTCVITACNRPDGKGSCDLYIMFWEGKQWSQPQNMRSVNTEFWESNPSLSSDGKYLYFSSSRSGGFGKTDIWRIQIDSKGNALKPAENLGGKVNTPYEDISPFIHPDCKTLYFASKGHPGLGSYDLFVSKTEDEGRTWSKPKNIGYPINTLGEERSLIVNAKGDLAMFSSSGTKRDLDIFGFELPPEVKPVTVTYVKGYIYDSKTNERLKAKCEMLDIESGEKVVDMYSQESNGEYMVCLPIDKDYAFNVSREGYLFYSENFSLTNLEHPEEPYIMNIPLQPIEKGVTVVLKNIFFKTDSYDLLPDSYTELGKVVEYMNANPKMKIEIGGHTDNVGTKAYNKTLSENRAKSVYNYLVSQGIAKERLSYSGYDFSVPVATNDTEEGRAQNRRTEFKVVSIE